MAITEMALRGATCWWTAPTYQMASQVWQRIKTDLRPLPNLTIRESEHTLTFPGGGSIAIRSTHYPDHLRGAGLDFVILDEAAFMEPMVWPQIIRPMLLEKRGSALFLSTPFGRNWFWELYKLGLDPEEPDWSSFHFKSSHNPMIPAHDLETIRRTTPDRVFREEYLAEFITDAGQVFRGIQEAIRHDNPMPPDPTHRYVAGVDWGRDNDYTCIVVTDSTTGQMVAIDRFHQIGWALQRDRLKHLVEKWRPATIWAEENSIGSVNIEALQNAGLPMRPFQTTARSKAPLIEGLALAIERGELGLLPDEVLLNELASYTMERLPGGGYRYTAPPGGHDDTVIALALAWHGVRYSGAGIDFA